jgi:phosphate starvation-inducible PhoH-like protein
MRVFGPIILLFCYLNMIMSFRSISNSFPKHSLFMKKVSGTKSVKSREIIKPSIQLSHNQQKYYDSLISPNISLVVGLGPAGSGKTLLACQSAILALQSKEVDKIIITRPLVSVDEELGFLPGTFQAKMDPWVRPIFDILRETFTMAQIQSMIEDGFIEISPLAYMRGRTFKRSFIIADEMQNSSPNQMKMILTRIGQGSKMVITGDLFQSDRDGENGLSDFMIRYNDAPLSNEIACIELSKRDVHRSSIVSTVLDIYEPEYINTSNIVDSGLVKEIDHIDDPVDNMVYNKINDAALIPRKWNKNLDW